jgi:hypothetical protein
LKNQKEILSSIRAIQEKLGLPVENPPTDVENPSKDPSDEDDEAKRKKKRALLASIKWKSTLKSLTAKRDEE